MTQIPQAARNLFDAAVAASQSNDSVNALELFAQAGSAVPGWALPHFLMGSEYASLGQWDKAEGELANAVLLDPALSIARYQLGLLQFSSGRAAVALLTWQPLLVSCPEPGLADFVRGFAVLARDSFEEATESFRLGLAASGVNVAVAKDIQLVMDRMPGRDQRSTEAPTASHEPQSAIPAHVLVANYGKFNLH